jgi:hypothetical protein
MCKHIHHLKNIAVHGSASLEIQKTCKNKSLQQLLGTKLITTTKENNKYLRRITSTMCWGAGGGPRDHYGSRRHQLQEAATGVW